MSNVATQLINAPAEALTIASQLSLNLDERATYLSPIDITVEGWVAVTTDCLDHLRAAFPGFMCSDSGGCERLR
ncbi:hypothetical protein GC175_28775 [bacterium]|nr:hypothetical protein [bacterium]